MKPETRNATFNRLPDGTVTDDVDLYLEEWAKVGDKMESLLGWKTLAFNPGFQFEVAPRVTVSLPLVVVQQIIALVAPSENERDEARAEVEAISPMKEDK